MYLQPSYYRNKRFKRASLVKPLPPACETPVIVLYPSVQALDCSQALEDNKVKLVGLSIDDQSFEVQDVGVCFVPSSATVSQMQAKQAVLRQEQLCNRAIPLLQRFFWRRKFRAAHADHQHNVAAHIIRQRAAEALAEKDAKQEAELCAAAAHLVVRNAVQRLLQQEQIEQLQYAQVEQQKQHESELGAMAAQHTVHDVLRGEQVELVQQAQARQQKKVAADLCATIARVLVRQAVQSVVHQEHIEHLQQAQVEQQKQHESELSAMAARLVVEHAVQSVLHEEHVELVQQETVRLDSEKTRYLVQVSAAKDQAQQQRQQWEETLSVERSSRDMLEAELQASMESVSQLKGLLEAETRNCDVPLQQQKQVLRRYSLYADLVSE
ncbi:hypothetical protein ABBQ38_008160 [Trebouxia sp. C0009 RCD-2024]